MYQEAMESLKSSGARTLPETAPRVSNQRGAEEFPDDWLVEDVRDNKKKRKRPSLISLVNERNSCGSNRKSKEKEPAVSSSPTVDLISPVLKSSRPRLKPDRPKCSKQPLISSLVSRSRTPSPLPPLSQPSSPLTSEGNQLAPATTAPAQVFNILKVKVSISGELVVLRDNHYSNGYWCR